jgi:hypothetical protein
MTFGEHLEELRRRVIISLLAFGVSFCVALGFQDQLMRLMTRPYRLALPSTVPTLPFSSYAPGPASLASGTPPSLVRGTTARTLPRPRRVCGGKDGSPA